MSTMEQALRDEISWHEAEMLHHDDWSRQAGRHRARLAALTAALPAPGVEAPGDWVMVPRKATDAMTEAAKEYLDATDLEIGMAYDLMLAAAPSAPAEISQAQAQAMREALEEAQADLRDRDHAIRWLAKGVDFERTMPNETRPTIRAAIAALTPEPPR